MAIRSQRWRQFTDGADLLSKAEMLEALKTIELPGMKSIELYEKELLFRSIDSNEEQTISLAEWLDRVPSGITHNELQDHVEDHAMYVERRRAADQPQQPASMAALIDGNAIAKSIVSEVKLATETLQQTHGVTPGLAVVLVGNRPDSAVYVRMKKRRAAEMGFHNVDMHFEEEATQEELMQCIDQLNSDPLVHGILLQLPLPSHVNEAEVLKAIRVDKDADGFSALNIGNLVLKGGQPPLAMPCTPAGCMELLRRSGVQLSGKRAVVLGRSNIVGMPVAHMLQDADATVTVCHSRTRDTADLVRQADIVVAAIGQCEYVQRDWLKPGCVVIDVGMNSKPDGTKKSGAKLCGDVDFDGAATVASQITPVPGGVGPMTIALLLKNTLNLARNSCGLPPC